MRRSVCSVFLALCCLASPAVAQVQLSHSRPMDVQRSIDSAVKYVLAQLSKDGYCETEYNPKDPRFGVKTLLCAYALISAEVDYRKTPKLRRAIQWAMDQNLRGTYPVALRAMTLAALKDDRANKILEKETLWLKSAAYQNGAYTHTSANGQKLGPDDKYDNDSGFFAAMGMWATATRGVEIDPSYWKITKKYWLEQQRPDGGWSYRLHKIGSQIIGNPYGSTTAEGIVVLSICFDQLGREEFLDCKPVEHYDSIDRGLNWLRQNFSVKLNPRKGPEWYFQWLFALQRVGLITGRKYLGGVNWYKAGSQELISQQQADGSWHFGDRIEPTCLALLFLTKGGAPILVNKLNYPGLWNARPHDAAKMTEWLSYNYERGLGWQVVDIDSRQADWNDGRILYISGAGPIVLTDEQVAAIRNFVDQGGTILSEAAGDNGEFSLDMHRLYQRIFPRYRLLPVPADHPVYNLQFSDVQPANLLAVTNGARLLAIHSQKELSRALEIGSNKRNKPTYNLLANLYMYLTDKGADTPRGLAWPIEKTAPLPKNAPVLRVAKVQYRGLYDPEPAALVKLGQVLAHDKKIKLEISQPLTLEKLDAKLWPAAYMTGTGEFELTDIELAGLKKYLSDGGTIIGDATGGSRGFIASFEKLMRNFGEVNLVPQNSAIYQAGPYKIDQIRYRRALSLTLPRSQKRTPRLEAVYIQDQPRIVFSPDDLTAGLIGYPLWGLKGYLPADAQKLTANMIHYANVFKRGDEKKALD